MTTSFPLLAVAIAAPAIAGWMAWRATDPASARLWARIGHGTALVAVACGLILLNTAGGPALAGPISVGETPLFALDGLSALAALVSTIVGLAAALGAPVRDLSRERVTASLWTQSAVQASLFAVHLAVLGFAWAAVVFPGLLIALRGSAPLRRAYLLLLVGTTVPAALAVGVLLPMAAGGFHEASFDIRTLSLAHLSRSTEVLIWLPIVIGVLGRMAVVPLHSWLLLLLRDGPVSVATMLTSTFTGAYLVVRLGVPIMEWAPSAQQLIVELLALVSASYGALLALGSRELRMSVAGLVMSQTALVTAGLFAAHEEAFGGALLFCMAEGLACAGLLLMTRAVEGRLGAIELDRFHGLYRQMPRLAAGFFGFALATVGFPGLASFVGEDLVLEGVTHGRITFGVGLVLVVALNAIAAMRVFCRAFLGVPERAVTADLRLDIRLREAVPVLALAGLLLVFGLLPQVVIPLVSEALTQIAPSL